MLLKSLFKKREVAPPEPSAFVCEVIQTYDGFSIRKVGTEQWVYRGYRNFSRADDLHYYTWVDKKTQRSNFPNKDEAIKCARRLEDEDHLRILREKERLRAKREREAFVEKKVWR